MNRPCHDVRRDIKDDNMATLIPAIGSCKSRMTNGEKRVAERLEQKLDDGYLLWYECGLLQVNSGPLLVLPSLELPRNRAALSSKRVT
jgi:hypothetical protein